MKEPRLGSLPVLILAGGLGTRLRRVVPDRPKGLAVIGNESFLEIQVRLLRNQGARRFVLCVGHRAAQIKTALGDGRQWGVRIDYSVEEGGLLGTAGALKLAARFFLPRALVVNGDTFFPLDYGRFVRRHLQELQGEPPLASLVLARAADRGGFGHVDLDISKRTVVEFREKSPSDARKKRWLNAGVYLLEREVLDFVPRNKPCSLERDVFPQILAAGRRLAASTTLRPFFDIGTPEGLERFRRFYATFEKAFVERKDGGAT
jgi:NDP-sugar pyrophosphorylase family protein